MNHKLIFLGKTGEIFLEQGIEKYHQRLRHYTSLSIEILKEKKGRKSGGNRKINEGKILLQAVSAGAYKIVLDSRGTQFTSTGFAKKIMDLEMRGVKQVAYLIGGPDGLSDNIIDAADLVLSFSKMTFPHDMIRLFLMEQLYRAYTIKAGERYHK
ncbi:23S rRNA (pseudouridine(1915)-N(3))-methyltransferase RlmH [Desulfomarina sp.]